MMAPGLYARHGKRVFDVVGASAGMVLLVPLVACLAGLIRIFLGAPVLFRQRRHADGAAALSGPESEP